MTPSRLRQLWLAAWLGCALWGCGDAGLTAACDIRQEDCQDRIFYAVQELRGGGWDPWLDRPPMRTITAEAYRQELLDAQAARDAAREAAQEDGAPAPGVDHFNVALELLGLLDPDREPSAAADARVDRVAAFYAPRERAVTIIDHGKAGDLLQGTVVLAHELVHAAQDRELGLGTFKRAGTRDADYARLAIIEGEARLYENLVSLRIRDIALDDVDWAAYHDNLLSDARTRVADAESPEYQLYGMSYPLGSRYLTSRYLRGGNAAVRRAWRDLPTQLLSLMAGPGEAPLAAEAFDCAAPEPPEGFAREATTTMGALPLFAVATRLPEGPDAAWTVAKAWRGDRLWVFAGTGASDATLVVWQLRLADAGSEEVVAFVRDIAARYGEDSVRLRGDELFVRLQRGDGPPADWTRWQRCEP